MNWSLRVKLPGNLSSKFWVALVEKKIVADVHSAPQAKHLDHDQLYTKARRLLANFLDCELILTSNHSTPTLTREEMQT